MRICEGIAAHRKLDSLGKASRPFMSVDQMRQAVKSSKAGDCPSAILHEEDGKVLVVWDDISG